MATRAAIHVRISLDAAMDGLAIERQREGCKAIAKQRGWTVVHTYVDQLISKEAIAWLEAKIRSLSRGAVHIPVLAVENPAQHFLGADLNIQHHTSRYWPPCACGRNPAGARASIPPRSTSTSATRSRSPSLPSSARRAQLVQGAAGPEHPAVPAEVGKMYQK